MTKVVGKFVKRGNEKIGHQLLKRSVALPLKNANYDIVLYELNRCDITAIKTAENFTFVLGLEIELTTKHILNNVRRNIENGYDFILIVSKFFADACKAEKLINSRLSPTDLERVDVIDFLSLTPEYLECLFCKHVIKNMDRTKLRTE